jgi:integrase
LATVFKNKNSPYYQAHLWVEGRVFSRSTKRTSKREAQVEADRLEKLKKAELEEQGDIEDSTRIDHVAGRYMNVIGDHHAGEGASITRGKVDRLVKYFGPDKDMLDITQDDVLTLKNWRMRQKVGKGKSAKPISPFTVNDTTEQLKKLFTFLKKRSVKLRKTAPDFTDPQLWLEEPGPRPRVLSDPEQDRLEQSEATLRPDYEPLFAFADATGKRKSECIKLKKIQIDWDGGEINLVGKRNKPITIKITPAIRAILEPLREHSTEYVFTFVAQRTVDTTIKGRRHHYVEGQRYPITKDGLRRVWTNARVDAGIPITGPRRYRFHDKRHNFASRLLKSVPTADGIKIVQEALGHADISTTLNTYSHTDPDTVAAAMEALAQGRTKRKMAWPTGKHDDHTKPKNHTKRHTNKKQKAA